MTGEKFVPDPWSGEAGGRIYRTGDRARFRRDGNLEFLGRKDHQVKIRGYRIEPGEVEGVLSGYGGVKKVMVMVREDVPGEKRLTAYVAGREEELKVSEIREYLKERLPGYMVPTWIVVMEELPVGPSGKINPRDLPKPEMEGEEGNYKEAGTEVERKLVGIWEEVLGVGRVGIHDNFFELGGDSILSIQVITKARGEGLQITPRQIFERQTIAELAELVESGGERERVEAEQGAISGRVPLTPIQAAFFGYELEKKQHFNHAVLLELDGEVETALVEEAVEELVKQHDVLRMKYVRGEQGWEQWCEEKKKEGVYERRDLSGVEAGRRREEMERDIEQVQAGMDLEAGRLMKVVEYELGEEEGKRLLLVIHHLLVDGVSWRILLEDLKRGDGTGHRAGAGGDGPGSRTIDEGGGV
jgi:aryl carrier-like protein